MNEREPYYYTSQLVCGPRDGGNPVASLIIILMAILVFWIAG